MLNELEMMTETLVDPLIKTDEQETHLKWILDELEMLNSRLVS